MIEMNPHYLAGKNDRSLPKLLEFFHLFGKLCDHALHYIRAERKIKAVIPVCQAGDDILFQIRVQRHHLHAAALAELSCNCPLQCYTDILRDRIQILHCHGRIHDRLDDRLQILDRNALLEQIRQDLLEATVGDHCRDRFLHELRRLILQILHQADHLLPVQQFVGMLLHGL